MVVFRFLACVLQLYNKCLTIVIDDCRRDSGGADLAFNDSVPISNALLSLS